MGQASHLKLAQGGKVVYGLPSNCAKNGVFTVQLLTAIQGKEELAAIAVGTVLIGTGHQTSANNNKAQVDNQCLREIHEAETVVELL